MLRIIRGWLCILCIALLAPLLLSTLIMTDWVIPIQPFSTETVGTVIDSWHEDSYGDKEDWCTVKFLVNGVMETARVRSDADVGDEIQIKYHEETFDYSVTALTDEDILYWLATWYAVEMSVLSPSFLLTLVMFVRRKSTQRYG